MNNEGKTFILGFEKILDYLIEPTRYVRRIDGQLLLNGKGFSYSAYRIEPASGDPIIRIDIKQITYKEKEGGNK